VILTFFFRPVKSGRGIGNVPQPAARSFNFSTTPLASSTVGSGSNLTAPRVDQAVAALGAEGGKGTSGEPVHVVFHEPGVKAQLWKTVRTLALAFLLIAGLSSMIEDRGVPKGLKEGSFFILFHLLLLFIFLSLLLAEINLWDSLLQVLAFTMKSTQTVLGPCLSSLMSTELMRQRPSWRRLWSF